MARTRGGHSPTSRGETAKKDRRKGERERWRRRQGARERERGRGREEEGGRKGSVDKRRALTPCVGSRAKVDGPRRVEGGVDVEQPAGNCGRVCRV